MNFPIIKAKTMQPTILLVDDNEEIFLFYSLMTTKKFLENLNETIDKSVEDTELDVEKLTQILNMSWII